MRSLSGPAFALVSIFALPLSLAGCVAPLMMGGRRHRCGGGVTERDAGTALDDQVIRGKINKLWLDYDSEMYSHLWLSVQEGRVLVAGKLEKRRAASGRGASRLASRRRQRSRHEIQIGDRPGFGTYIKDSWILTQIRSSLTFEPEVSSMNISLECVDGIVYVMGVVRDHRN